MSVLYKTLQGCFANAVVVVVVVMVVVVVEVVVDLFATLILNHCVWNRLTCTCKIKSYDKANAVKFDMFDFNLFTRRGVHRSPLITQLIKIDACVLDSGRTSNGLNSKCHDLPFRQSWVVTCRIWYVSWLINLICKHICSWDSWWWMC